MVKGGPPLWLAVVQIFLYVCVSLKLREREVSSRDAHSVANLATLSFQTPLATFFPKKATGDKSSDFLDKL